MYEFFVSELEGEECVPRITEAVRAYDPKARVEVDPARKSVKVDSRIGVDVVRQSITELGYRPLQLQPGEPPGSRPGFSS
jgi:copper chaperone CopZ